MIFSAVASTPDELESESDDLEDSEFPSLTDEEEDELLATGSDENDELDDGVLLLVDWLELEVD